MQGINWGDAPSWFAAIGTVGAFGVSIFLFARSQIDRRLGQARLITAWQKQINVRAKPYPIITYVVRNDSQEPAFNVVMGAMCGVRGTYVRHIGVIGPGEFKELRIFLAGSPRAEQYAPDLAFVDAAGRQWLRNSRGKLMGASQLVVANIIKEDAGAYGSLAEHPTLRKEK
jgi:hypothetical protein